MKKEEINKIIKEAKKNGVEVSFYCWTTPKQYRRSVHTDNIQYITGTMTGIEYSQLANYAIDTAHIYDDQELNSTIYANSSEVAEPGEQEMIVIIE